MELVQPIRDKSLVVAMYNAFTTPRDRLLWALGIYSGLRVSDILSLKVADVRGKTHIEVKEKKTEKTKLFALNAEVVAELEAYGIVDMRDDEYLLQSRKGDNKPIQRDQAYKVINAAARAVGITERVGTHTMRKTFGYHAYHDGTPVETLQFIFNHSSTAVTLRYIGITQDTANEVYQTISFGLRSAAND